MSGDDGFQWCPEVIPLFSDAVSALTHWLSRRLWQKAAGLLAQRTWMHLS